MTVHEAIRKEYLVWNKNIWENAREYCKRHPGSGTEYLIPVLDENNQLFCFAYEDLDANREVRMLRELTELPDLLQFTDIYTDYKCVKIHEFNELAYFFAKYLERLGITVEVTGTMWRDFFDGRKCNVQDYECFTVYAEGIDGKKRNWRENLLRSVSVEFECIDKIFEENLKRGLIKDADGNCESLIAKLQDIETLAIVGIDIEAQDAYDYLMQMGIEVCCFVAERNKISGRKLLNKPVFTFRECVKKYGNNIVFIDNYGQHSTFGCSMNGVYNVDYLDYLGYERNRKFFMLRDYIRVKGNSLKVVLKNQKIVLTGDIYLCERLIDYYKKNIDVNCQLRFGVIPDKKVKKTRMELADVIELEKDTLILVVVPEYLGWTRNDGEEEKRKIMAYLDSHNFINYTDYFSYAKTWIILESEIENKYPLDSLRVNRVVLGSIESCCGYSFFKGLLDNHPYIMMMNFESFDIDLFWFCVRLAGKTADEVISVFELLFNSVWWLEKWEQKNAFIKILSDTLGKSSYCYTSQQLFILFHIAYMRLYGRKIENIGEMIIYWAPHLSSIQIERYEQWLSADNMPCDIVNVVRNICMSKGSRIKGCLELNWSSTNYIYRIAIEHYDNNMDFCMDNRIVLRFEDIKCNPKEELSELCKKLEIPWSDSLMSTTHHDGKTHTYNNGKKDVRDFDLTPVYNNYEEYFSEFDRFRITLICASWQKQHGYPYADILAFSRRELQEMFLKEFRFANRGSFDSDESRLLFYIGLQNDIRRLIQREYMVSALDKN